MELANSKFKSIEEFNVISDLFSQAITGELIGMSNFASLAETIDDYHEKIEAVEHANSERMHAEGFLEFAEKTGLNTNINLKGAYWNKVREQFLTYAKKRDFIACLFIQEVILESFAVSMYTDIGTALGGEAGKLFLSIAEEEKEHLEHSTEILCEEFKKYGDAFIDKIEKVHFNCMTILAQFSATTDLLGHCGVCHGDCMKGALHHVGLKTESLRGNALSLYLKALDNIGIPGEKSIVWIAQLPA